MNFVTQIQSIKEQIYTFYSCGELWKRENYCEFKSLIWNCK